LTEFEKYTRHKISQKSIQWEPSCCMQMTGQIADRHDATNSLFSQFYDHV